MSSNEENGLRNASRDVFRKIKQFQWDSLDSFDRQIRTLAGYDWWIPVLELGLIALFALWVGRAYLNLDPQVVPFGREFGMTVQSHHFWNQVRECGWCALWNGFSDGGYPAFVEVFGAPFHPLVASTTLLWGVFNGAKVGILISLWVAGFAQWWIARELRVGWLARIWSALTAVSGAHLAGNIEGGHFTILMSTAFASLVVPAILALHLRGDRRSVVRLAIVTALAILGGQGYLQVGIIAALPAIGLLLLGSQSPPRTVLLKYARAGMIALLLAAPLIVPTLLFSPHFSKYIDPEFQSAQPLEYLPLNLVIDDPGFYINQTILGKWPAPALYTLYIGWAAVILAILGVGLAKKEDRATISYLSVSAILVFLTASGVLLKWIVKVVPLVAAVRFPSLSAGYAVPMILGLSAYGLDRVLNRRWPNLMLHMAGAAQHVPRSFSLKWLLLVPLVANLRSTTSFAHVWLSTARLGDDVTWVIEKLETEDLQWVSPPYGEHYFITPTVTAGLKVTPSLKPWGWKDRELPVPRVVALRGTMDESETTFIDDEFGIFVYLRQTEYYASVVDVEGSQACQASGSGGRITVECENQRPGVLVVKENVHSGWKAWRGGETVPLIGDTWLKVEAPAGNHVYRFEFLPWDVPLGLILALFGIVLCAWLWFSTTAQAHVDTPAAEG